MSKVVNKIEDLKGEIWKPVVGYEGFYEVSNLGNIKSLDRTVKQRNRWGKIMDRFFPGKMLSKNRCESARYQMVALSDGNMTRKTILVHRIVAKAFIPNTANKPQVNHINGEKKDNRVVNLEWCDGEYNIAHAVENGLMKSGKHNSSSRLVINLETGIFYDTCKDACKAHNIKYSTLAGKLNGSDKNNTLIRYA